MGTLRNEPVGPYRDSYPVTIGTEDFALDTGFTCQAGDAGSITYRTLDGVEDLTIAAIAAGDTIVGPGNVPVLLQAVRGSSTITSIIVGILIR